MSPWPFGSKQKTNAEPSTMERLVNRNCSRDEFILLYSKLLQERYPNYSIEFAGESVLRILGPEGEELTSYLDNLWLRYKDGSEDRRDLIERFVRFAQDACRPAAVVSKSNIVPMIKDSEYVAQLDEMTVKEHLCGDLWIVYAVDESERMSTLKRDHVSALEINDSELRTLAVRNLCALLPPIERHGGGPWYLLSAGQDYVASLLLLDDVWSQLADSVEGSIVAAAPSRDILMYTGSDSPEGLAAMRAQAAKIVSSGSYVISESLLIRQEDRWSPFNAN